MPRGWAKSNRDVGTGTDTATIEREHITVSAATATDEDVMSPALSFDLDIRPAEKPPVRSPAGRTRTPSPFEDASKPYYLPGLKGKGWHELPHDGQVVPYEVGEDGTPKYNKTTSIAESNAKDIHAQLQKAVKWFNSADGGQLNLGLDVFVTSDLVQFNIRDKQKRADPSKTDGSGDIDADLSEDDELDSDNGDE